MKRILSCALACLLLCACGGGEKTPAAFEPEAAVQSLLDSGAYSEALEAVDVTVAVMLFGLEGDPEQYEGSVACYSTGATSETAAVFRTRDEEQAAATEEALRLWIEDQIDACRDYQPAEVEKLEHAVLEVRGNTVLLAVAADWDAAAGAVPSA